MTTLVEFDVYGTPAPQGSKKAFVANGRAMMTESSAGHAAWRNAVAEAASRARDGIAWGGPFDAPLILHVTFRFPMPASRRKADRERGWCPKTTAPDVDKLIRTIGDALQAAGLIVDDARFTAVHASKVETVDWSGVSIRIARADG